jgi:hypothetical protein
MTLDPTPLPPATRQQQFEQPVSVSVEGTILQLDVVLLGNQDEIEIVTNSNGFVIKGRYVSGWEDVFTYVEAGESDLTDTPKTAIDISNMPPDKNLYDLDQDTKQSIFREYTLTIKYADETAAEITEVVDFTHEVQNDLEAMRSFMANYNYNGSGG